MGFPIARQHRKGEEDETLPSMCWEKSRFHALHHVNWWGHPAGRSTFFEMPCRSAGSEVVKAIQRGHALHTGAPLHFNLVGNGPLRGARKKLAGLHFEDGPVLSLFSHWCSSPCCVHQMSLFCWIVILYFFCHCIPCPILIILLPIVLSFSSFAIVIDVRVYSTHKMCPIIVNINIYIYYYTTTHAKRESS